MRHATHDDAILTHFESFFGLALFFIEFGIPKNPYIQSFMIYIHFLHPPKHFSKYSLSIDTLRDLCAADEGPRLLDPSLNSDWRSREGLRVWCRREGFGDTPEITPREWRINISKSQNLTNSTSNHFRKQVNKLYSF